MEYDETPSPPDTQVAPDPDPADRDLDGQVLDDRDLDGQVLDEQDVEDEDLDDEDLDDERWDLRSQSREHALTLLYEAATRDLRPREVLAGQVVAPSDLTVLLLEGVDTHQDRLDALIAQRLRGWTMERLALVDLNVLRLGVFELLQRPEVPIAVVIDEAVELAKRYSTPESARFVNGVLSAIAAAVRPVSPPPEAAGA